VRWATKWGAIATDATKGSLGATTNMTSREEAQQLAIIDCQNKGGTQCKLQIAYDNQCAVMVLGDKVFNIANADTISEATRLGMQKCDAESANCHVYYSACSMPQRTQ
jgi:hypothetical protein